jgi:hypothetical protein
MYWSASDGGIHGLNRYRKKTQAMSAIENGLTSQLTKSVTNSPRGRRPTSRIAPKSTFIIIGVIISQMSTAIGMLIWLPSPNSRPQAVHQGRGCFPMRTPTIMQSPTHRLRYRSKAFRRFGPREAVGGGTIVLPCEALIGHLLPARHASRSADVPRATSSSRSAPTGASGYHGIQTRPARKRLAHLEQVPAFLPPALAKYGIRDAFPATLWLTTQANGSIPARRRSSCRAAASCTGVASGNVTRSTFV